MAKCKMHTYIQIFVILRPDIFRIRNVTSIITLIFFSSLRLRMGNFLTANINVIIEFV